MNHNLRSRKQCISARNRRNPKTLFFLALVRPHLDNAVQFWPSYYRINIVKLGAVQINMTKMIQGIRNLTYKDTLKHLNLHSSERRMVKGDLIEVFKWLQR